jgi:hypothetical protein
MKIKIIIILMIYSGLIRVYGDQVKNYIPFFGIIKNKENNIEQIVIRKFIKDNTEYLITVDPDILKTSIVKSKSFKINEVNLPDLSIKFINTSYIKALIKAEKKAKKIQNAGFTHFMQSEKGVNLTADLCPSKLPLNRDIFNVIIKEFSKTEKPVPIGLAVTGLWMEKHEQDIKWLVSLEQQGELSITWINHSYNHKYNKKLPVIKNFLLEPNTDINFEVLETERKMLELGLLPSVFFRFPGLVSDFSVFKKITDFGLIPVGSDAWLGKDQWPKSGSIVLIHANGNEPIGVKRFLELINSESGNILQKHWFLYDLRESVAEEEKVTR